MKAALFGSSFVSNERKTSIKIKDERKTRHENANTNNSINNKLINLISPNHHYSHGSCSQPTVVRRKLFRRKTVGDDVTNGSSTNEYLGAANDGSKALKGAEAKTDARSQPQQQLQQGGLASADVYMVRRNSEKRTDLEDPSASSYSIDALSKSALDPMSKPETDQASRSGIATAQDQGSRSGMASVQFALSESDQGSRPLTDQSSKSASSKDAGEGDEDADEKTSNSDDQCSSYDDYDCASTIQTTESNSPLCNPTGQIITIERNPASQLCTSLDIWLSKTNKLLRSNEMQAFLLSSKDVVFVAGDVTFHMICLPVSIPIYLVCETKDFIAGACSTAVTKSKLLIDHVQHDVREMIEQHNQIEHCSSGESTCSQDDRNRNNKGGFIKEVASNVIPFIIDTAEKIKNEVGSTVMHMVTPVQMAIEDGTSHSNGRQKYRRNAGQSSNSSRAPSGQSSSEKGHDNFLDRLRLDYDPTAAAASAEIMEPIVEKKVPPAAAPSLPSSASSVMSSDTDDSGTTTPATITSEACGSSYAKKRPSATGAVNPSGASSADVSKYLLFVGDLELKTRVGQHAVQYIDLGHDFFDEFLALEALDKMFVHGVALFQNNEHTQLVNDQHEYAAAIVATMTSARMNEIQWSAEGSTSKLLRKKHKISSDEWNKALSKETLIWSGKFSRSSQMGHPRKQHTLYLARGIVKRSPKDFLDLLWDNNRTEEYNNFSSGRQNVVVINDNVLNTQGGPDVWGTKVVKSETRVPFTGLSVLLITMMHVRPLPPSSVEESLIADSSNQGYIIISRSLDCGMAGTHLDCVDQTGKDKDVKVVKGSSSEILWGINVLRPVPGNPHVTDLISLSQVGTSMVPGFLSHRIGIMGIEDFFKNVRQTGK